MFERQISRNEVASVIAAGELIEDYPGDQPLPSCLLLGILGGRPLHVVVAREPVTA